MRRLNLGLNLISAFSLLVFLFLFWGAYSDNLTNFNNAVTKILTSWRSGSLTPLMIAISAVLKPAYIVLVSAALAFLIFIEKRRKQSFFFFLPVLSTALSIGVLKALFDFSRPDGGIIFAGGSSFPSGHAALAVAFFLSLVYLTNHKIKDRAIFFLLTFIGVSLSLLSGLSRIYLGVHFPTDVIAGFSLGLFWVTLTILISRRSESKMKNM